MSDESEVSLPTLPVELLHRILDDLDSSTVLLSVRNISRQLKAVVDTYDRYTLDFTSISKPDFHRLLRVIRPRGITALMFCDSWTTPGHISALLSLTLLGLDERMGSVSQPCQKMFPHFSQNQPTIQ